MSINNTAKLSDNKNVLQVTLEDQILELSFIKTTPHIIWRIKGLISKDM